MHCTERVRQIRFHSGNSSFSSALWSLSKLRFRRFNGSLSTRHHGFRVWLSQYWNFKTFEVKCEVVKWKYPTVEIGVCSWRQCNGPWTVGWLDVPLPNLEWCHDLRIQGRTTYQAFLLFTFKWRWMRVGKPLEPQDWTQRRFRSPLKMQVIHFTTRLKMLVSENNENISPVEKPTNHQLWKNSSCGKFSTQRGKRVRVQVCLGCFLLPTTGKRFCRRK